MMDVETLRISQRIEILNNISTQATLLAGSSIAFLGGEALETVDDHENWTHIFGRIFYVAAGSLALVSSLWVIVIASHLIALTRDASLRKNILKASRLLDKGMREVRGVHQFALGFVLLACLSGALLNMAFISSLVVSLVFAAFAVQVMFKQQYLSVLFYEEVELEPEVAAAGSLVEIADALVEPLRPRNIRRIMKMWEAFGRFLEEQEREEAEQEAASRALSRARTNGPGEEKREMMVQFTQLVSEDYAPAPAGARTQMNQLPKAEPLSS